MRDRRPALRRVVAPSELYPVLDDEFATSALLTLKRLPATANHKLSLGAQKPDRRNRRAVC